MFLGSIFALAAFSCLSGALGQQLQPQGTLHRRTYLYVGQTYVPGGNSSIAVDQMYVEHLTPATVTQPLRIPYRHAPILLRNIQIDDTRNADRVVTVIEVLSPWNKLAGKLNRKYV